MDNLGGDKVAFERDRFSVRAQNGQCVSVRSSVSAPDNRSVGNALAERRGDVWAVEGEFGFMRGLCAVRPSLLGVREADRDVEGGARVAKGGGEDVGGSEVSAKNEARNLGLSSAVAGLRRCVYQRSAPNPVHLCPVLPASLDPWTREPQAPTQFHDAG